MAGDAPFHLQRVVLINGRHLIDASVTRRTANALCHMDAVVKIDKLRQVVDPFPLDRFVFAKAGPDRLEIRAVRSKLTMTVHAGLRRRHTGGSRRLDRCMAIATVDAVVADMVLMAELDRLLFFQILACQIGRTCDLRVNIKHDTRPEQPPSPCLSGLCCLHYD